MTTSEGILTEVHVTDNNSGELLKHVETLDEISSGAIGFQRDILTCQLKHETRRDRAVTNICRFYQSVTSLAKEYTTLFTVASQGFMGMKPRRDDRKRKRKHNYTSGSMRPHNGHSSLFDVEKCAQGITRCSIVEIEESTITEEEERQMVLYKQTNEVNPVKETSEISRVKYGNEYLLKEKKSNALFPAKNEVIRSETRRINELFRKKGVKSQEPQYTWTRTTSATLAINKANETNVQHLEEISTTKEQNFYRARKCPNCDTILHFAASNGELDIVKFYVEKNLLSEQDKHLNMLSQQNKHLNTGLHCAVYYGHKDVVDLLLKHEPGIDMQNIDGDTALHIAVTTGKQYIVTSLIKKGANLNKQNNNGDSPLHLAAHKGCTLSTDILIKSGAKVDLTNKSGNTALHTAINGRSNKATVETILQAIDGKRQHFPIVHNTDAMLDKMIDNLRTIQTLLWKRRSETFEKAVVSSDWRYSLNIVPEKLEKKEVIPRSVSGLLIAKLKETGARDIPYIVNMKNGNGDTALHRAVRFVPKMVPLLLQCSKIETKFRNRSGETALHLAVKTSNLKCQKLLTKQNKRLLDISDNKYNTPLHWAAEWGFCRSVKYLLPPDYKKDMQNHGGNTSLHLAILNMHYCIVWYLLENNADVRIGNLNGDLPLHCAVKTGNLEIFQLVLKRSYDVIDYKNNKGDTALMLAIKLQSNKDSLTVIDMLVKCYADINVQDGDGNTALHLSTMFELSTISYMLISTQTAMPYIQNNAGNTVFHLLTKSNNIDMIRFLINCTPQADFHSRNKNGDTPLSLAIRGQHLHIATLLLNYTWKVDLVTYSQLFE